MEKLTLYIAAMQSAVEKNDDYELNSKDDGGLDSGHTRCVSTLDLFVTHEIHPEELFECTQ